MIDYSYTVVTVSSHAPTADYYCYNEFFESLRRCGVEPLVLKPNHWGGLGTKPRELYKAIKSGLIKTRYLIFCDSWDLVFARHPHCVMHYYWDYKEDLICSAEKNCFPANLKIKFDELCIPTVSGYNYLNSGFIVSSTEAMLAVLESMDVVNIPDDYKKEDGSMEHINDQLLFQQEFLKQPVRMKLDRAQLFSQTMHMVTMDELTACHSDRGNYFRNKTTFTNPCTIHFNGSAKDSGVREPILKHLGLL